MLYRLVASTLSIPYRCRRRSWRRRRQSCARFTFGIGRFSQTERARPLAWRPPDQNPPPHERPRPPDRRDPYDRRNARRQGLRSVDGRSQVICPSGCFLTGVSSLFSGFPKNISFGSDRKSTRLNSSHDQISYAVFCLKKKKTLKKDIKLLNKLHKESK